jgi:hypothetical protein
MESRILEFDTAEEDFSDRRRSGNSRIPFICKMDFCPFTMHYNERSHGIDEYNSYEYRRNLLGIPQPAKAG